MSAPTDAMPAPSRSAGEMLTLTLPDGATRQVPAGTLPREGNKARYLIRDIPADASS